jgi:hypothetical protein
MDFKSLRHKYFPGPYSNTCCVCQTQIGWCDKLCFICETCFEKAVLANGKDPKDFERVNKPE